ncbi:MAG: sensor histidine kinase [Treponema sp.]
MKKNFRQYAKLFLSFAGFTIIIFALLWIFQTVFLQKFYNSIDGTSAKNQTVQIQHGTENYSYQSGQHRTEEAQNKTIKNPYLEEKFLSQTKTVLQVQLVIAVFVSLVLSFIFSIILSGRLFDEKLQKARLELLANVSHDLRTPLTLIKGYAENIAEFSYKEEELCKRDVKIIIRETDRLSNLVNDILEYSFVQDKAAALKNENFDLSQLAKECAVQFGEKVECVCVMEETDRNENAFTVKGDKKQLSRVIYNFLDNAIRHSPNEEKVRLTICKTGMKKINVRLSVQNFGDPIKKQDIPLVWDRYFTASKRRATGEKSGLGLAIAKGILENQTTDYGVSSDEKNGTVFWFEMKNALL